MNENPLDALTVNGAIATPKEVLQAQEEAQERQTMFGRTLAAVAPLIPEEQDPNVLFRNNWLARGQAVQLTASSGVGKSSMTMQTALNWAAGRNFLAEPMRPLKCAIIQSEDSERDVAEQIEGMRKGLLADGWSAGEFERVLKGVLCPTCFIGVQGVKFIKLLRQFQQETQCDMLFINPVQAFFGDDVSDQKAVSQWARGGIDPIIKDPRHSCGVFLVSHTTKFTSGDKQGRANVNDYGEYIGAGSHEWLDWVRAKFVFLKHGSSDEYFDFKAAKRGKRLAWKDLDGESTTCKIFRHSENFIYWQEVRSEIELDQLKAMDNSGKRPDIGEEDAMAIADKMVEWIRKNRAVTKTELSELGSAFKGLGLNRRQLRAGGNVIKTHYADVYHMQYTRDGFGYAEGLRVLDKQREQQRKIDGMNRAYAQKTEQNRFALNGSGDYRTLPDLPEDKPPSAEKCAPAVTNEATVAEKAPTFGPNEAGNEQSGENFPW